MSNKRVVEENTKNLKKKTKGKLCIEIICLRVVHMRMLIYRMGT